VEGIKNQKPSVMKLKIIALGLALTASVLFLSGCRKNSSNDNPISNPTKFSELKVNRSFTFANFISLNVNIRVSSSASSKMNIIQIYQDDPSNGKLIISGVTIGSQAYTNTIRIPKTVKSLYISYTSSDGKYESAIVTINGSNLDYVFGGKKSAGNIENICGTGTPITTNQDHVTIFSDQTYYVPYGSTVTIHDLKVKDGGTFNNCGTVTVHSLDLSATDGTINNNGTFTFEPNCIDLKGTFNNNGVLNVTGNGQLKTNSGGNIINNCKMIVEGDVFTTGSGSFTNNGYLKITEDHGHKSSNEGSHWNYGSIKTTGGGVLILGPQSLIDCQYFELESDCNGPESASYAGIKTIDGKTTGNAHINGYVDFFSTGTIQPDQGHYGPHVTYGENQPVIPSCSNPIAPVITSSLTAGGTANQAITPYVITATGTEVITYTATNLPSGLTLNSGTHTISGTVSTAGTYYIILTADNSVGTDTKTLVLTIGAPGTPPVITSPTIASATAGSPFSYTITATGTNTPACPLTFTASPLPAGLTLSGDVISGSPTAANTYDITLTATNCNGSNAKHLILTVGAAGVAPSITSSLTANGTAGTVFTPYTVTASGTAPIDFDATNLPSGLTYDNNTHQITGNPTTPGITEVILTASNVYGTDVKTLVITIAQGAGTPPVIQPPYTASGTVGLPFTPYMMSVTGTTPIVYSVTNLPDGLSFDPVSHVITGTPSTAGTFYVNLAASSDFGSDNRILEITITSGGGGSIISYYPNAVDYGTFVFEDLWPSYGDYDFNDAVVNFQYKITSNTQNQITDIQATFIFKAAGASLNNGFGFILNTNPSNIASVTGCTQYGNAVTYDPKGFEAGHSNMTVIIPVDAINTMFGGGFINTVVGNPYIQPFTKIIDIHFATPQASVGDFPWNPFIFQNQVRSHEIHLKNQPNTDFANLALFGTNMDASNPSQNYYYASSTGLPWAFEIPVNFDYPAEKNDILTCYNHFAEWAQGPVGPSNPYNDWYMDKSGYRNTANLWHP